MLENPKKPMDRIAPTLEPPPPPPPPPLPPRQPPRVHALKDNYQLTAEQHAYCVGLIDRIRRLYEGAPDYVESKGLDRTLFFPGNEWADIAPVRGRTFRDTFLDVNYLRLMSPFAGFYLMFLDRLDVRLYAEPWNADFLADLNENGMRDDIVDYLTARVDPAVRLESCLDVYGKVSSAADEHRRHIQNVPKPYLVRTPRLFGEIGLEVDGLLANPDTTLCQSRINGMLCSGVLDKLHADIFQRGRARVLEIGPGHGPLGQALRTIFGNRLEYIAVDLPSILYNSSIYLATLAHGEGCQVLLPGDKVPERFNFLFVANYLLEELGDSLGPIDLALNTMSFPEMSPPQVKYYALLLKRLLRVGGLVFDENDAVKPHHTDSKAIFAEVFPCRKKVSSDVVVTKNWCQDVWSASYVEAVFNCSDVMLSR
jgi:hypothetical protein